MIFRAMIFLEKYYYGKNPQTLFIFKETYHGESIHDSKDKFSSKTFYHFFKL